MASQRVARQPNDPKAMDQLQSARQELQTANGEYLKVLGKLPPSGSTVLIPVNKPGLMKVPKLQGLTKAQANAIKENSVELTNKILSKGGRSLTSKTALGLRSMSCRS